jgi:predicted small metal-binding protein
VEVIKMDALKKVSCDPMCGFSVQSHDYKELKKFVAQHSKNAHNMDVTDTQIEKMMMKV